jgi:hypothetical protein
LAGAQISVLAQWQTNILCKSHRAPQRAALKQHAHASDHLLAFNRIGISKIVIAIEDFSLRRLIETDQVPEQGALAATTAAHDNKNVSTLDGEVKIAHQNEATVGHGKVAHRDVRCRRGTVVMRFSHLDRQTAALE